MHYQVNVLIYLPNNKEIKDMLICHSELEAKNLAQSLCVNLSLSGYRVRTEIWLIKKSVTKIS